jgi:RNA polymerase sigma factor (sigma-70 family)
MRTPLSSLALASDRRLADDVGGGSEQAFETLFKRHQPHVHEFCRQMLGTRDEAEDAVQQTFLAAFRDLARGRRPRAMRPWLLGIARRRCLALLADGRRRSFAESADPVVASPVGVVAARDELRGVLADLGTLPEDQRAALILAELRGVSHRDIAEIIGCRRDKVKALVFQARESLETSRAARETPCADIRHQLATLEGGALRRRVLRRHLRDCDDCREFRARINGRRRLGGLLFPFGPAFGLKRLLAGAVLGSGGGGAALGGGATVAAVVAIAMPVGVVGSAAALSHDRDAAAGPAATTPATPATSPVAAAVQGGGGDPTTGTRRISTRPVSTTAPAGDPAAPGAATPVEHRSSSATAGASEGTPASASATEPTQGTQAPEETATGRPETPPGQADASPGEENRPASPPGQANAPASPPGQENRPASPPGRAKAPASPPGQENRPASPPGQAGAPETPRGQANRPASPPGQGNVPASPLGQANAPASPPGQSNAPETPPGQAGKPASPAAAGPPDEPPGQVRRQQAQGG